MKKHEKIGSNQVQLLPAASILIHTTIGNNGMIQTACQLSDMDIHLFLHSFKRGKIHSLGNPLD